MTQQLFQLILKLYMSVAVIIFFLFSWLLSPQPTFAQSCPKSDANNDCRVDGTDYIPWLNNYGQTTSQGKAKGDFNGNGVVDGLDYVLWLNEYGQTGTNITPISGISVTPPVSIGKGIWLSKEEIAKLPTSGSAWNNVLSYANGSVNNPSLQLRDYSSDHSNVRTYTKALVYARTGNNTMRQEVRTILEKIIGTHKGGDELAVLRNMYAYVISADLIDLKSYDPSFDTTWRNFIRLTLTEGSGGSCSSIIECHNKRPNNWGAEAGASRTAIALYLNDSAQIAETARVHKGYLGDRSSYAGFQYGELSWQCDASKPVGINAKGCTKQGHNIDGVLPDDQRRGGSFTWPPFCENYVWGALQGALVTAELLHRAGYPAWEWQDKAILRAMEWLHSPSVKSTNWCAATGDDRGFPFLVNRAYKTNFPASASVGKGMGFFEWTHAE